MASGAQALEVAILQLRSSLACPRESLTSPGDPGHSPALQVLDGVWELNSLGLWEEEQEDQARNDGESSVGEGWQQGQDLAGHLNQRAYYTP